MDRGWHLLFVLLISGLPASAAVAESGYLPKVGPPPLRFIAPRPVAPATPLPPESPAAAPGAVAATSTNQIATAPTARATNDLTSEIASLPSSLPLAAAPAEAQSRPAPELPPPPPPAIPAIQTVMPQPQLFLQYFTPDYLPTTNGFNGYGLAMPVGFIPPQPRAGSSSATYQVTTPDKN